MRLKTELAVSFTGLKFLRFAHIVSVKTEFRDSNEEKNEFGGACQIHRAIRTGWSKE
ncbi:hypothetical protein VQ056_03770 [Paenibacillus sp. JTLBN-2024]